MAAIKDVGDVVAWRLCVGCGACAHVCPDRRVRLVDFVSEGIRPTVAPGECGGCRDCLEVCPAAEMDFSGHAARPDILPGLLPSIGPVLELWEGHAADPEIRHTGSSGGALTALGLYCLEERRMTGVLHVGADPEDPLRNRTHLSRTREELLARAGSRYAPASACDRLDLIEEAPAPCAFIGQPAEVAALRKAQRLRPRLDRNVAVALSFFCAGSPATRGTVDLLQALGIPPDQVGRLRYRGHGWPGNFAVTLKGQTEPARQLSYRESWGALQKARPYGVHLWPDDSGEAADISCGDPWYREIRPGEPGSSLILARTPAGRDIIQGAIAAGYLEATRAEPWQVLQSQANLINKRRAVWGRRLAFRAFGLPVTRLKGFPLFRLWLGLPVRDKLRSTLGTARRIVRRRYYRPLQLPAATGETGRTTGASPEAAAAAGPGVEPRPTAGGGPDSRPWVGIMGASLGTGNCGVSALGASLIRLIGEAAPGSQPAMLIGNRDARPHPVTIGGTVRQIPTVNYRMSPRSAPKEHLFFIALLALAYRLLPFKWTRGVIARSCPWIKTAAGATLVGDIRGGDSFSDIYGVRRFLLSSLPVLTVIWVRGKIVLFPQTYGPFKSGAARAVARYILRRASWILSRDRDSLDAVRQLVGDSPRLRFCPDVAFALDATLPAPLEIEPPLPANKPACLVGLNVNGLMYHGGYTRRNMFGLKLDYPSFLRQLTAALLADGSAHLLLVPHTFGPPGDVESDPQACRELMQTIPPDRRPRVHLVARQYEAQQIKGIIGQCDFFIGSRMHSCIAALSQGVPTIGVAYSKKFRGVFESVGMADWVVDGREIDAGAAIAQIQDRLSRRMEARTVVVPRVAQVRTLLNDSFASLFAPTFGKQRT